MGTKHVFRTLDALRGIAALAIVIYHTTEFTGVGREILPSAFLAVDLFFIMSGVVLCYAYEPHFAAGMRTWAFFKIRVIRIYPLYALGILISSTGVAALLLADIPNNWSWATLATAGGAAAFMMPSMPPPGVPFIFPLNGAAWSLFYEMLANIAYVALFPLLSRRVLIGLVAVAGAGLIAHLAYWNAFLGGAYPGFGEAVGGILRVTFSFFMGVLICRSFRNGTLPVLRLGGVLPIILIVMVLFVLDLGRWALVYDAVVILGVFPLLVMAAVNAEPRSGVRLFAFLGAASYPVYALHVPLSRLFMRVVEKVTHQPIGSFGPLGEILFLLFMLLVAWQVDRYFDAPVRRWLTRLAQARPKSDVDGRGGSAKPASLS